MVVPQPTPALQKRNSDRKKVTPMGFEPSPFYAVDAVVSESSGINSGSKSAPNAGGFASAQATDHDLAAVIESWSTLPVAIKAGILAMVKVGLPPTVEMEEHHDDR